MAAITPSTVQLASLGSLKGTIAKFVTTTVDNGDYWSSGITDIVAILGTQIGNGSTGTTTGLATSYTASNGTIFIYPASENATVTLLVLSGLAVA